MKCSSFESIRLYLKKNTTLTKWQMDQNYPAPQVQQKQEIEHSKLGNNNNKNIIVIVGSQ